MMKKCHLIDLLGIKSTEKSNLLTLEFGYLTGQQQSVIFETAHSAKIIQAIREAHRDLTIGSPITLQMNVAEDKLLPLKDNIASKPIAGGFMLHYNALCSFFKILPSRDFIQYIESLYHSGNNEIKFHDCPGTESDTPLSYDLRPVFQSIPHNNYFRSLSFQGVSRKGILQELCNLLKRSVFITRVHLSSITSGVSHLAQLGPALQSNPSNALVDLIIKDINLSSAIGPLTTAFATMTHGFRNITFKNCRLNGKQISSFIQDGLMKNYALALTLQELNLSNNKIESEGSETLQKLFLRIGPYSNLSKIILRKCNLNLTLVLRSLSSFTKLAEFDISHNKLDLGSSQLLCSVIEQSKSLKTLIASSCGFQTQMIDALASTLVATNHIHALKLVLSHNPLSDNAISALMKISQRGSLLHTLDLSNCKLSESGIQTLISSLSKVQDSALDTLILNNAKLEGVSHQTGEQIGVALVHLVNQQDSIRCLSLAGGYSSYILYPVLEKLHDNESLLEINVSGNKIGDVGASTIASLIRRSPYIAAIRCGNNNIHYAGLQSLGLSIKASKTLQIFDYQIDPTSKSISPAAFSIFMDIQTTLAINRSQYSHPRFEEPKDDIATAPISLQQLPQEFLDSLDDTEIAQLDLGKSNESNSVETQTPGNVPRIERPALTVQAFEEINTPPVIYDTRVPQEAPPSYISPARDPFGEAPPPHKYTASSIDISKEKVAPPANPNDDEEEDGWEEYQPPAAPIVPSAPIIPMAAPMTISNGSVPPPPPPPGPGLPPPPPPAAVPKPQPGRGAMLSSITGFNKGKLKKAVTNDKSAPKV